jgi:hypothetical protein
MCTTRTVMLSVQSPYQRAPTAIVTNNAKEVTWSPMYDVLVALLAVPFTNGGLLQPFVAQHVTFMVSAPLCV